ncbi:MAG: class I SAM-dependent methyltransferase [Anaerolineales bacterium]|nr:class I SAM-dependent methyltransferase [Anaerolineales bacterium]
MDLSQVSRTAILLLICRAIEAKKNKSEFNDPMAVLCLERLMSIASEEEKRWIIKRKRFYEGIQARDAKAGVQRVKAFDNAANRFIADNPKCTVINLACGFDTRFWRIENEKCKYIEIDIPGVIKLKKEILKDHLGYEVIGTSVLDTSWIDKVTINENTGFLLLAEGLFPWIPPQDAKRLLKEIGERFYRSQFVLDMVPEKYTKGIWKKLVRLHSRIDWGLDVFWVFGIKNPHDIEAYGNGLKVIGEEKGSAGPIITVSINAAH